MYIHGNWEEGGGEEGGGALDVEMFEWTSTIQLKVKTVIIPTTSLFIHPIPIDSSIDVETFADGATIAINKMDTL